MTATSLSSRDGNGGGGSSAGQQARENNGSGSSLVSSVVVTASTVMVAAATGWVLIRWRARKRARDTVRSLHTMIEDDAPLVSV